MVRRKHQPAVDAKMYRHFAVITVLLTGLLAVFADGGNRTATAEVVSKAGQQAKAANPAPKFGEPKLIASAAVSAGSGSFDYSDNDTDFGAPTTSLGVMPANGVLPRKDLPIDYAALGMTREEFARLSPEEQSRLLARLESEQQAQTGALLAASARRSGGRLEM